MKPKKDEEARALAERCERAAKMWAETAAVTFYILAIMVAAVVQTWRLPLSGVVMGMFVLASFMAFCWYGSAKNYHRAVTYRRRELELVGDDCSSFLRNFMPSQQEVMLRLSSLAKVVRDACDAERVLYEKGTPFPQGGGDSEQALEHARHEFEVGLSQAKYRVAAAKETFWRTHRLVKMFAPPHYKLVDSWKPYAVMPPAAESADCGCEGRNEPPGK